MNVNFSSCDLMFFLKGFDGVVQRLSCLAHLRRLNRSFSQKLKDFATRGVAATVVGLLQRPTRRGLMPGCVKNLPASRKSSWRMGNAKARIGRAAACPPKLGERRWEPTLLRNEASACNITLSFPPILIHVNQRPLTVQPNDHEFPEFRK
jgi:hypothetical protein